jgi:hypothetical protein
MLTDLADSSFDKSANGVEVPVSADSSEIRHRT